MEEINELINSNDEWLCVKGLLLRDATNAFNAGELTAHEFNELLADIKNADDMNEESTSMENKALVLNVVNVLSMLA